MNESSYFRDSSKPFRYTTCFFLNVPQQKFVQLEFFHVILFRFNYPFTGTPGHSNKILYQSQFMFLWLYIALFSTRHISFSKIVRVIIMLIHYCFSSLSSINPMRQKLCIHVLYIWKYFSDKEYMTKYKIFVNYILN